MMNWMRKAKGSISIFLCLILLPMVTYSTMIIDAGRLQSARSVATTAGDLTMNAALSEYEQALEDMYGLFAVAQSDEDFKSRLKLYFSQTIEGQLMSGESREDYAQMMSEELVNMIYDDTEDPKTELSNFLEMQLDDFNYEPVNGSALANPAVMKRQIIEYMKYKGPVSLASTLFSKLDFLKNTSKQTEALDNKVKYTEKLSEIEDPCKRAYYAIDGNDESGEYGYNDSASYLNETFRKSTNIDELITNSKENYKYMTAYLIMKSSLPITTEITEDSLKNEIESSGMKKDYSSIEDMPEDTIEQMESKLNAWIDERNSIVDPDDSYEGSFESCFDSVKVNITENETNFRDSTYKAEIIEKSPIASSFYPTLQRIKAGGEWMKILDVSCDTPIDNDAALSQTQDKFNLQMNIANGGIDDIKQYIVLRDELSEISQKYNTLFLDYHEKMRDEFLNANNAKSFDAKLEDAWNTWILGDENSSYHNFYKENEVTTEVYATIVTNYDDLFTNFLKALSSNQVYKDYEDAYYEAAYSSLAGLYMILLVASEKLDESKNALNDVITAIDNAEKEKEKWRNSIGKVDSSSTKSSMLSDYETTTDGLEKKDVEDLIAVIDDIKPIVDKMISELETIKYLDKQVLKLYTTAELGSESGELNFIEQNILDMYSSDDKMPYPPIFTDNDNITANLIPSGGSASNVLSTAENLIKTKFESSGVIPSDFVDVELLDGTPPEKERFVNTLRNICNPIGKEKMSGDTEKEYEAVKNEAKQDENVQKKADELDNVKEAPKEIKKDSPKSEKFDEFMNAIKSYQSDYNDQSNTNQSPDSSTYKMTDVNIPEGDDAIKKADPGASLKNATSLLDRIAKIGTDIRDDAYMEEYFTEMFTCRTDALDSSKVILLNGYGNQPGLKPLNSNTEWYGKEIEYIIWGDSNLQNNLVKNDTMIYTIRFALNAVYAFTAADIQSFALEVATAIAGWTVIGVPVVQACVTIAIALAESAWDLKLLHQGEDVPIYKNTSTFICSPTGLSKIATDVTKDVVKDAVNTLEDELDEDVDKAVDSANKTVADCANSMEGYVNNYIEAQAEQVRASIESQFVTPLINKITPIMVIVKNNTANVKTEVEKAIDEAYDAINVNINSMNDGIVKDLSLEFFNTYANEMKHDLVTKLSGYFNQIENQIEEAATGDSIKNLLVGKENGIITKWIGGFTSRINASLDTVKGNMMDKLRSATEEPVGNLKSYMHEQMDSAAEEITGKVSEKFSDAVSEHASDVETNGIDSTASSGGFSLNYKEYCKIFVLLNIAFDETKMLQRSAVLIQANVRNAQTNANPKFEMVNANTLVSVNASVRLGTLFPWTVSDDINDATGDNDVNLDFSHLGTNYITMNYNGINGY